MNTPLNKKEREMIGLLQKVESNVFWFSTVRSVIAEGINWKIRRLLAELKSQRSDNPDVMRMIIGQKASEKLRNL